MSEGGSTDTRTMELAEPVIVAERLGLRTRRGWVYEGIDLAVSPGSVTAVAGAAGSGRSMLLLTVAGRARPSTGRLTVAGAEQRGRIRRAVNVARVTSAVELDPDLLVLDHRREADLLAGSRLDFRWAAELVGLTADPADVVGELPSDEAALLAVALAVAGRPTVVVLDDVDVASTPAQQRRVWAALGEVGRAGITVLASTLDPDIAIETGAVPVRLAVEHGRHERQEGESDADR